jgi:hypothetical protein
LAQSGVDPGHTASGGIGAWYSDLNKLAQTQQLSSYAIWSGKGNGVKKGSTYVGADGKKIYVGIVCLFGLMVNFDTNCEVTVQNMG